MLSIGIEHESDRDPDPENTGSAAQKYAISKVAVNYAWLHFPIKIVYEWNEELFPCVPCGSRYTGNFEQLKSDNRHTREQVSVRSERWRRCATADASLEANGGRCQPHSEISCANNKIWNLLLCRKDESEKESFSLSSICWLFNKNPMRSYIVQHRQTIQSF